MRTSTHPQWHRCDGSCANARATPEVSVDVWIAGLGDLELSCQKPLPSATHTVPNPNTTAATARAMRIDLERTDISADM
jgi:hypothetical protein